MDRAEERDGIFRKGDQTCTPRRKQQFQSQTSRGPALTAVQTINAVVMGRKSWESIPPKYRPLKDRMNVVITRNTRLTAEGSVVAGSVEGAKEAAERPEVNKAFIIGGAEIYKAALERKEARRILLTRVLSDFDCDAFFPLHLDESGKIEGWERKSKEEHDRWVGEQVPEGVQEENGTRYVFEMWEKTKS